jgi:undecaprenyl-diphosphatase
MTSFQALVMGILQGLTEFLPISSSAHLALAPWLFGWKDPGLAFDVALHFGSLLAVLWYFRAEWARLIGAAVSMIRTRRVETIEQRRVLFLIIATIPGAIGGLLLEKKAESAFRAPALTATALIVMGIILWISDRFSRMDRRLPAMGWLDSLLIGLSQVLALVPGVSRSGATVTTGRLLGFDRESAAIFSFLMSMPIIAAAVVLKGPEALHLHEPALSLIIGVVASALSAWLAISVLLRYVIKHSYGIFAVYRILLGIGVFVILYVRG